jgi:predicted nucleotidyltransferase
MNKAIKYAINGGIVIGLFKALINANSQIENKGPGIPFDWNKFFKEFGKGAATGAIGGFVIGSIQDDKMTNILAAAGGATGLIKNALNNYTDDDTALQYKAKQIQRKLYEKFGSFLSEYPKLNGSTQKGTAIIGSDIDIILRFKKNATKIGEMPLVVEEFLTNEFNDSKLIKVRDQEYSYGLFFKINGESKRIDIVPMREIENGYGDAYIFSKVSSSIKKTNSKRQNKILSFTEKQKKIIKLIKGLKMDNSLQIQSTLIEHMVLKAFEQEIIPHSLEKALLTVIDFIAKRIVSIRIVDPANTNNIISDNLSLQEKENIRNFFVKMLEDVVKDKRNFIDYFPNFK